MSKRTIRQSDNIYLLAYNQTNVLIDRIILFVFRLIIREKHEFLKAGFL